VSECPVPETVSTQPASLADAVKVGNDAAIRLY
jgi:hypothetical protein